MRKGQINFTMLASIIGVLFTASIGAAWKAFDKAEKVGVEISDVKVNIGEIKTDVRWIREALDGRRVAGSIASSSIDGYRSR